MYNSDAALCITRCPTSTIVKIRDKRSGIVYAYSSTSYWDKEKKQGRSHRKLLGRVDETTGEIVPTSGRRGRLPKKETAKSNKPIDVKQSDTPLSSEEQDHLRREIESKNAVIVKQSKQLAELSLKLQTLQRVIAEFQSEIAKVFPNNN